MDRSELNWGHNLNAPKHPFHFQRFCFVSLVVKHQTIHRILNNLLLRRFFASKMKTQLIILHYIENIYKIKQFVVQVYNPRKRTQNNARQYNIIKY